MKGQFSSNFWPNWVFHNSFQILGQFLLMGKWKIEGQNISNLFDVSEDTLLKF